MQSKFFLKNNLLLLDVLANRYDTMQVITLKLKDHKPLKVYYNSLKNNLVAGKLIPVPN